ncbi:hypothetical protein FRC19_002865 [Serendipita sp. 401]|nr:hypothetical protein FRC19_002865 [Serendipita sp. 401]
MNVEIVLLLELLHYNPLLPLKQDIPPRSLNDSTPRRELVSLLDLDLEKDALSSRRRRRLAHQISMVIVPREYMTTGRPYYSSSVFWEKWDFIGNRPLPAGIKRYYSSKKRKVVVVVQKTGEEYNPSHWEELS